MQGKRLKVLIAAGGSGGHLLPAQQLGFSLQEDAEVVFAGHRLSESPFFRKENFPFVEIAASPMKKGFLKACWRGFWQAFRLIRSFRPDVVVGFGSFHSFPVLLAAAILRKKIVLFEANCVMGRVNRLFLPFAKRVASQFLLPVRKGALVPLLPWRVIKGAIREEAREYFGLARKRCTLLIFGGSQGATFLNEAMPQVCEKLRERGHDIQVVHLSGRGEVHYSFPACVKSFEGEMAKAYAAADVAICRSGAGTVAELIRYQVPALLIPFPFATEDHQRKNAEFLSYQVKGAKLLLQKEATLEKIVQEVESLIRNQEKLREGLAEYFSQVRERIGLGELVYAVGKN